MGLRFSRSAARHGISEDRARYVIENCPTPLYAERTLVAEDRVMFLWADAHGVPLEVGAIELDGGELLVIHAMKLRKVHEADYARLLEWQKS